MRSTVQVLYLRVFAKRIIYHYMVDIYQYLTDDARVHEKLFDGNINYRFSILMIKKSVLRIIRVPRIDLPILEEFEDYYPSGNDKLCKRKIVTVHQEEKNSEVFTCIFHKSIRLKKEITGGRRKVYQDRN